VPLTSSARQVYLSKWTRQPEDEVFRRPDGLPYERPDDDDLDDTSAGTRISSAFSGACRRAKITDFHPHDCRHTWATWHYAANRDLGALQRLGGWKSVSMVMRYAHVNVDEHKHTIDRLPKSRGKPNCRGKNSINCNVLSLGAHALGKGEVVSSILPGSTRKTRRYRHFRAQALPVTPPSAVTLGSVHSLTAGVNMREALPRRSRWETVKTGAISGHRPLVSHAGHAGLSRRRATPKRG
jgi:hypothetical protein